MMVLIDRLALAIDYSNNFSFIYGAFSWNFPPLNKYLVFLSSSQQPSHNAFWLKWYLSRETK